jgi:RNA polymerase sigma factor FliA
MEGPFGAIAPPRMSVSVEIHRDKLIADTLPYVRKLAVEISRELPRFTDIEELVSAGREGLVQAAERYDPSHGVLFRTFAHYRIRGAILDYVRESTSASLYYRARAAAEAAVDDIIATRLDGCTTDTAVGAASSLAEVLCEMATAYTLAEIAEQNTADDPPDPEQLLNDQESSQRVHSALDALPERERQMLREVYYAGRSIEGAGLQLGLSKSWASRLHARGISLLREALTA